MRPYLISSVFSLSLISLAQAAELTIEQQCQALGYDTKISECEKAGSAALICPLNDGYSGAAGNDGNNMAVCITDSCRGYPLYKKSGKFYYQDQAGNEVEAVPSKGQLTDHMEGGFETCVAGYGDNAVTYYRVPKCKGEALYNNYFCDVGCDTEKKYPYTYHPGNTAGVVQKCVTADQTYYGYSSCNKGWLGGWSSSSGVGKCSLDDCNMIDYPYPVEPNAYHYRENRGKTETCKIGGATYYRYKECTNGFVLRGTNANGAVCVRRCVATNCTNNPLTYNYPSNSGTAVINDWSCKIADNCVVGDIVTYNDKDIGILLAKGYEITVNSAKKAKTLILPINYTTTAPQWATGNALAIDVPQLNNNEYATWGKIQTMGVWLFKEQSAENGITYSYPAVERCFNYAPDTCGQNSFCSQHEWYLPSYNELKLLSNDKYIVANSIPNRNFIQRYWSSTENYNEATNAYSNGGVGADPQKRNYWYVMPYLAF